MSLVSELLRFKNRIFSFCREGKKFLNFSFFYFLPLFLTRLRLKKRQSLPYCFIYIAHELILFLIKN
jgi:hypothetical protein